MMLYNCSFDDEIIEAVKTAAQSNLRSVRKQLHLYVIQGLQRDGFLPTQNKTGLSPLTANKPATDTPHTNEE